MGRYGALLLLLGGCFSWAQRDAPPREEWNAHHDESCGGRGAGVSAIVAAGLASGVSAAILASTNKGDLDDIEERSLLLLTIPMAVVWSFDALNAFSDASVCSDYKQYRRSRRLTITDALRQGPADDRGDRPRERDSRNAAQEASP